MKKKVVIGMSGGVDSSVAAYLLKKEGYEVTGIMLKQIPDDPEFAEDFGGCCSLSAAEDARRVADKLDIPFYVLNFKAIFEEKVIEYFVEEYSQGRTPNPCVMCNKKVRFSEFLRRVQGLGADYIATGHYARIDKEGDRYLLKKPFDIKKDQTYMLYNLTQDQLKHVLMPNAGYTKPEIRAIAEEIGLDVYRKKDSVEICFIPDNDHGKFIKSRRPEVVREGNFVDKQGNILGTHKGIVYYTIGQRKGLGLSLGKPAFVTDINPKTNEVVIGDEEDIFKDSLIAKDLNFIPFDRLEKEIKVMAKIRYSAKETSATIMPIEGDRVKVVFDEKVRAITPGQAVVFYDEDVVVGGGIIE